MYRLAAKVRPHWATVLFLAIVVAWFVWLCPSAIGGPAGYILVSGISMEPTLQDGDLVVTQTRELYEIGDVVAFKANTSGASPLVIHRIIGGSADDGYELQGDNNAFVDPWRPTADQIVGEAWMHIPAAHGVLTRLQEPVLMASAMSSLAVFLVMLGARGNRSGRDGRRRRSPRQVRDRRGVMSA